MVRKLVIVVVCLSIAMLALPASADTGSITDKKGDATGCNDGPKAGCDIVKATWGHASNGRLMHQVSVAGQIGAPLSGHGSTPRLMIDVPGQKFDNPTCDYYVGNVPPGVGPNTSTTKWKWYVQTCQNTGSKIVGPAAASQVDAHTVRLVFNRKLIGSPGRYGWSWVFPADGDNPPYDQAPNKGYKPHVL